MASKPYDFYPKAIIRFSPFFDSLNYGQKISVDVLIMVSSQPKFQHFKTDGPDLTQCVVSEHPIHVRNLCVVVLLCLSVKF